MHTHNCDSSHVDFLETLKNTLCYEWKRSKARLVALPGFNGGESPYGAVGHLVHQGGICMPQPLS